MKTSNKLLILIFAVILIMLVAFNIILKNNMIGNESSLLEPETELNEHFTWPSDEIELEDSLGLSEADSIQ